MYIKHTKKQAYTKAKHIPEMRTYQRLAYTRDKHIPERETSFTAETALHQIYNFI